MSSPLPLIKNNKGITLVELIVSMVILSFLGGVIYITFSQGLRIWNASVRENASWKYELFFEEFKQEIRNAYVNGNPAIDTKNDALEFYSYTKQLRGEKMMVLPAKIRYMFDPVQKAVNREETPLENALGQGAPVTKEIALEGVSGWHIEYYQYPKKGKAGQASWVSRWKEPCLPEAVKVTLNSESRAKTMVTRVIALPASGICKDQERT